MGYVVAGLVVFGVLVAIGAIADSGSVEDDPYN